MTSVVGKVALADFFFSCQYFCFPCPIISPMPHTALHLHAFLSRRTNGRRLGTFQKQLSYGNQGTLSGKVLSGSVCRVTLLLCGNKMPTRCNRGFYCRSYRLLNMFWASLCPSSGAEEYYTVVAACGICAVVRFAGCCSILQTGRITLSSTPDQLLEKTTAQNTTHSNHCIILLSS